MLFFFALLFISSTAYPCGPSVINPPADLSQPIFYPVGWTDGQPYPILDTGLNCMLKVIVPTGYYANVTFHRFFHHQTGGTYVIYTNHMSPHFYVNMQSNISTHDDQFAFKVYYMKLPTVNSNIINVSRGNPPVIVVPNDKFNVFQANSQSKISLSSFSAPSLSTSYLLRQTLVFDSDTFSSRFLGTLEQAINFKLPFRSTQNKIGIYTFGLEAPVLQFPLFMGQDSKDAEKYNTYQGENCLDPDNQQCVFYLDGTFGNSMTVTSYNGTEVIGAFWDFPQTAHVNVYENRIDSTTKVASLGPNDYRNQLPIAVKGVEKFYELIGSGVIKMGVTRF
uniref:CUB_2 domain-containing protein n=1 Tax=Caenorhabditis tropicalis TaxID=1561998 RepID=A0A1I7TUQ2_9PELO